MFCSPKQRPDPTLLPGFVRDWLGARLSGPPRGAASERRLACIYALGRVGDFILALSAIRLLIEKFGALDCVLVVSPAVVPLARCEFPGVALIELPAEGASFIKHIVPAWRRHRPKFAGRKFAHRISLRHQRSLYHEVTSSWIDADRVLKLTPKTYPARETKEFSTELLAHARLVEMALERPLASDEIVPRFVSTRARDDGFLLVFPLSRDVDRHIPATFIVPLLRRWRERHPGPIMLGGSPSEAAALTPYLAAAAEAGLQQVTLDLPHGVVGLVEQIARAHAVLTAETAAAHIATAFDKPTVVLLGGFPYGLCYPWRRSARQVAFSRTGVGTWAFEEVARALETARGG